MKEDKVIARAGSRTVKAGDVTAHIKLPTDIRVSDIAAAVASFCWDAGIGEQAPCAEKR